MSTYWGRQLELGYISAKRPLKGEPVYVGELEPGVRYRFSGANTKGHLPSWHTVYTDQPLAWCGLPFFGDEAMWIEDGSEEVYGPYVVVRDSRKGSQCGPCNTREKRERSFGSPPERPVEEDVDLSDVAHLLADTDMVWFRRRCEAVRRQLGGVYV